MIQVQNWHESTRYLIMMNHGRATIQLQLYKEPIGEGEITAEIYGLWVNKEIREQKCNLFIR